MCRRSLPLFLIAILPVLFSCHKSSSGGNSAQLTGNYQFLYLSAQTQTTELETGNGISGKTIAISNYKTVQNTGSVSITKDSIATHGVGYTANMNVLGYFYQNGSLVDSFSMPSSVTVPAYSSATKYDLIGKDSIFFHGGSLVPNLSGGSTVSMPSGGRYSFKGDTLFITENAYQSLPPQSSGGITVSSVVSIKGTIALLKH